jgi:hypothetical protein
MLKSKDAAKETGANALARKALEEIERIDREAEQKKREQVVQLQAAATNIRTRIAELQQQLDQVEAAVQNITGKAPKKAKAGRNNYGDLRERIVRWLGLHPGEKFGAKDLQKEFPELSSVTSVAMFLRTSIQAQQVFTERKGGPRSTVYFVAKS